MSKQYVIPLYNCLEINKQPVNQNIIEKVEWQETRLEKEIETKILDSTYPTLKIITNSSGVITDINSDSINSYPKYVTIIESVKLTQTYILVDFDLIADVKYNIDTLSMRAKSEYYGLTDDGWKKSDIVPEYDIEEITDLSELSTSTGGSMLSGVIFEIKNESRIKGRLAVLVKSGDVLRQQLITFTCDTLFKKTENVYEGKATTNNIFHMETNEFLHLGYKETGSGNAKINAKNILLEYQKGKQTIELKVVTNKYYDLNGNLMIDNELGEIPRVGDTFYLMSGGKNNFNYSHTNNILYKITSSEFNYDGVPKLVIKAKEV